MNGDGMNYITSDAINFDSAPFLRRYGHTVSLSSALQGWD